MHNLGVPNKKDYSILGSNRGIIYGLQKDNGK